MNTFWLKIAGFAVVVVGLIILVKVFPRPESKPETESKTVYDVWEQDDQRLRAEPQYKEPPRPSVQPKNDRGTVGPTKPVVPMKPQFRELGFEEKVEAERLINLAIQERKMGRLPAIKLGYKKMVDHCREIIRRWPDSEYAFKAKRMLADIPVRYRKMYNITDEEIDLGNLK